MLSKSLSDGSRRFDSVFRNNFCQPPRFFLPFVKKTKIRDFVLILVQIRLEKVMTFQICGPREHIYFSDFWEDFVDFGETDLIFKTFAKIN